MELYRVQIAHKSVDQGDSPLTAPFRDGGGPFCASVPGWRASAECCLHRRGPSSREAAAERRAGGRIGGGLGGYRAFSWAAVASQVQATWEGCGCIQRPGALRLAWGGITSGVSMAGCSSSRDPECLGGVCNAYPLGLHGHDGQDGEARSWHGHPHSPSSPGGSCHAEMLRIQPLYAPNAVLGPCRRGHREVAPKRRSPVTTEVEMSKVTLGYRPAATPRGERGWRGPSWSL